MRQPRRNKYNAQKTVVDGITFDSKKEAKRYGELKMLEKAGKIHHLELQPKFKLAINGVPVVIKSKGYPNGRQVTYRADFAYFDYEAERRIVEDVKGMRTDVFKLKKAIVEAMFPKVEIREL